MPVRQESQCLQKLWSFQDPITYSSNPGLAHLSHFGVLQHLDPSISLANSPFCVGDGGRSLHSSRIRGSMLLPSSCPSQTSTDNQRHELWLGETENQGHVRACLYRRIRSTSDSRFPGMATEQQGSWRSIPFPSGFRSSWASDTGLVAEILTTACICTCLFSEFTSLHFLGGDFPSPYHYTYK